MISFHSLIFHTFYFYTIFRNIISDVNSNNAKIISISILDKVCKRPWNFERVPNAMIQGHDRALIFTSTKEACLAACLNEVTYCFNIF